MGFTVRAVFPALLLLQATSTVGLTHRRLQAAEAFPCCEPHSPQCCAACSVGSENNDTTLNLVGCRTCSSSSSSREVTVRSFVFYYAVNWLNRYLGNCISCTGGLILPSPVPVEVSYMSAAWVKCNHSGSLIYFVLV